MSCRCFIAKKEDKIDFIDWFHFYPNTVFFFLFPFQGMDKFIRNKKIEECIYCGV